MNVVYECSITNLLIKLAAEHYLLFKGTWKNKAFKEGWKNKHFLYLCHEMQDCCRLNLMSFKPARWRKKVSGSLNIF